MVNILYIFNLFINLLSALKFRVSKLYIIIKNYTIQYIVNNNIIEQAPLIKKDLF